MCLFYSFSKQYKAVISRSGNELYKEDRGIMFWSLLFCCRKLANRSRIHERTISLRFLAIILRVLRLEVSVNNVYITNQFETTFAQVGGGRKLR
jgi:hypothetical protein